MGRLAKILPSSRPHQRTQIFLNVAALLRNSVRCMVDTIEFELLLHYGENSLAPWPRRQVYINMNGKDETTISRPCAISLWLKLFKE